MTTTAVLHVWGVSPTQVASAVALTARWQMVKQQHPRKLLFGKALGTGSGLTFTLRDSDPCHWGLLTVWSDAGAAADFEQHHLVMAWARCSTERLRIEMSPISARGSWSGATPLSPQHSNLSPEHETQPPAPPLAIAAITRARIKPRFWRTFARSVPEVSTDLHAHDGPLFALGIGEAPIGLQGTFSLWRNHADIDAFAYQRAAHRGVIAETARLNWYAEEMFARLAVTACDGTYRAAAVLPS